jgi:hypothetical protein
MAMYERTAVIEVDPDELFHLLADVGTLPDYMAQMVGAERIGIDRVQVTTDLTRGDGRRERVTGEVWFKLDRAGRHMAWGSAGPNDYHGELEVTGAAGVAWVRVRVFTQRDDAVMIERNLAATLANIARLALSDLPPG